MRHARKTPAIAVAVVVAMIGAAWAGSSTSSSSSSNIIEKAQPDLNALKKDEAEIKVYLAELQSAYDTAANRLKTARSVLADAERGLKRAEMAMGRANDRAEAAALAAGVSTGGNALNTALGAMQRKTVAIQDAVVAADLRGNVLQPQDHEKDDPAIAAAMASAAGEPSKPQTAAERIAALKSAA